MTPPKIHIRSEVYQKRWWWPVTDVRWWVVIEKQDADPVALGPLSELEYAALCQDMLETFIRDMNHQEDDQ